MNKKSWTDSATTTTTSISDWKQISLRNFKLLKSSSHIKTAVKPKTTKLTSKKAEIVQELRSIISEIEYYLPKSITLFKHSTTRERERDEVTVLRLLLLSTSLKLERNKRWERNWWVLKCKRQTVKSQGRRSLNTISSI